LGRRLKRNKFPRLILGSSLTAQFQVDAGELTMTRQGGKENRKTARVAVSKGVWVAWQTGGPSNVSRVRDLSAGGVFISTAIEVPIGTTLEMLFALPEGEARIHGIVRYADGKSGIGVEFTRMGTADRARFQELLRRLNR
jgi:PilZ domain